MWRAAGEDMDAGVQIGEGRGFGQRLVVMEENASGAFIYIY